MKNTKDLKFYSYSGFAEPQLLAVGLDNLIKDLVVESNYLGDVTEDTVEELTDWLDIFDTIEEMQEHDENHVAGIWINPTYKNLSNYNLTVGLDEESYLKNFKENA
ncbi:hypothetical protein LCFBJUUZ_CDS0106 [Staphylococcus phage PG-2021_76]